MEHIGQINPLGSIPSEYLEAARKKWNLQRLQKEKEEGYQQLTELCNLEEYDAAKRLADQNSRWGYEIIEGVVMERIES